jgi:hypothetical protein
VRLGLRAPYQIPSGHQGVPTGTYGGTRLRPIVIPADLCHLAQRTGVPTLFVGPNGTKQGMAFAAFEPGGTSG